MIDPFCYWKIIIKPSNIFLVYSIILLLFTVLYSYCLQYYMVIVYSIILSLRKPFSFISVLLYPPDIPHSFINKQVKTPGAPLLSSHYADPPKRPRTPIEVKHKDRVRRSQSGRLLIDSRHRYPQGRSVAASGSRANLSTGKAIIRRKVDCWMSFEEYDRLTRYCTRNVYPLCFFH